MTDVIEAIRPAEADEGGKRRQILDGARRVFLDSGFDAASMNEIARTAGVSKGTLYVYFASKEALFEALVRHDKREQIERICEFDLDAPDLASALHVFGVRILSLMLQPDRIAQLRIVMAVSAKFPQIGEAFYESGPCYGRQRLAAFLRERSRDDALAIANFEQAAEHFVDLCKSRHLLRAILCVGALPDVAEIDAHVAEAVEVFLRAYRAG